MKKYIALLIPIISLVFYQCEPDHETVSVSTISPLPRFEYEGGQFMSVVQGSVAPFADPGARAWVNEEEVRVISTVSDTFKFNTREPNVYVVFYFAQNEDKIITEGRRIVAITHESIAENDLSGTYITSTSYGWEPVKAKVRKKNNRGWYTCTEVMGFPGVETKGEFVDIGKGELILLPGESFFGDYDIDDGNYTFTSLSWSVNLIDEPYSGVEIPVMLIKSEE